jgi:WD40 repeat protein
MAVADFDAGKTEINDVCVTAENKGVIAGEKDGGLKVWEVANPAKPAHQIKGAPTQRVQAFAASKDGKRFATASMGGVVRLYDAASGKELRTWDYRVPFQEGRTFLSGLAFSPDGKRLYSANADATVWVLDAEVKAEEKKDD